MLIPFFFLCVVIYFAFESWDKYTKARINTNVREFKQRNFQYPSITVCPEKTFKTGITMPKSGTIDLVKLFYLDNVRSLEEVFFFVNQKTWSREGHKCMTEKVSEDPGRPCVFPFFATVDNNGSLSHKCIVPQTYKRK